MSDPLKGMFGGDSEKVIDRDATRRKQNNINKQQQSAALQSFLGAFGNPTGNTNFQESLSGYYNNTPFDDIAKRLASQSVYKIRAKPVKTTQHSGLMGQIIPESAWDYMPNQGGGGMGGGLF